MGRKLHYIPGSYYQTDDRTGFPQRAGRMRAEWDGLIVARDVWEPRQPQDLVKGVRDNQNVDNARPLGADVFIGPTYVQLSANVGPGATFLPLASVFGFALGDTISVMTNSGVQFGSNVSAPPVPSGITIANPLTDYAASGNLVTNYGMVA